MKGSDARRSIAGSKEFVASEITAFQASLERFRGGLLPEPVFLEERLRMGVYGQRQDGVHMMRSKLPLGIIAADQLEAFADLAEVYGGGVAHLTTRQDIQVHFVELERSADFMRVLDEADMTSREACGNVVRNVTAASNAGVSPDDPFDVTPYGLALARFLLRHPDGQGLGRKFKVHLAGSFDPRWNLSAIHDLGATAVVRERDGVLERGFDVRVGGGLGAVPYEALVLEEFLPANELGELAQALLRVFGRLGEKKNRARARLKFLVAKLGLEGFREELARERAAVRGDESFAALVAEAESAEPAPLHAPTPGGWPAPAGEAESTWLRTNVHVQRQAGYHAVAVRVPRGDLDPEQLRGLARLMRRHAGDHLRITPEQGLLLRNVPTERLLDVRAELVTLGLGAERAWGLDDVVTCPGADTCKLGITSPRSVARTMEERLARLAERDPRVEGLRIKISGCPNGCAQHQVADIGFTGAARTVDGKASPHYMLMLGGRLGGFGEDRPGDGFGIPVTKVPAARVGEAVESLVEMFLAESFTDEAFSTFVRRQGRKPFKDRLAPLTRVPSAEEDASFYREPGAREGFAIVRGTGECAGEVVDAADLLLAQADARVDTALDALEGFEPTDAGGGLEAIVSPAREAMVLAARALLSADGVNLAGEGEVREAFRARYYATGRVFEGIGHTFFQALDESIAEVVGDRRRRLVVETGLFVDEAHSMLAKMRALKGSEEKA